MKFNQMLTGAVACVSLIGMAPAYAASKAPAAGSLSVAKSNAKFGKLSRAATLAKKGNRAQGDDNEGGAGGGGATPWIIGGLAAAAVIGGVVAGTTGSSAPTSP